MVVPLDRWKVDFMENPTKMDEEKGYPHDFGNLHMMFWDQIWPDDCDSYVYVDICFSNMMIFE